MAAFSSDIGLSGHWGDVVWDFDETTAAVGFLRHDSSLLTNPIGWMAKVIASEGGDGFVPN